ncbi:hypothetical protein [Streptomyces sp. TLI_146]|uniref:hypothetical protein n=1 Tax=Streptomyces sp. TLI_146 TaxID=1938858 RepID=UPI000C70244A|nr:hypothetical protein [Streptomyces sp. TLI_146]
MCTLTAALLAALADRAPQARADGVAGVPPSALRRGGSRNPGTLRALSSTSGLIAFLVLLIRELDAPLSDVLGTDATAFTR